MFAYLYNAYNVVSTRQLHSEKMWSIAVHLYWFSCVVLQTVSADDIPCNVTQDGRETLYTVPEFTANRCNYQWTNINDSVLANQRDGKDKIVAAKDVRTLRTYECLKNIRYQRDCISEGTPRMATCTSNCTRNAEFHEGPVAGVLFSVIAVILVAILVLSVLCFLCIRRKLCSRDPTGSCNHTRCVYRNVKTSNQPPNTTDEEAAS